MLSGFLRADCTAACARPWNGDTATAEDERSRSLIQWAQEERPGRPRRDDFLQFGSVLCGEYFDHKRKSGISLLKHFAWLYKRRSQDNGQFSISRRDETQRLLGHRRSAAGTEVIIILKKSLLTFIIFADLLWSGAAEETWVAAGPRFTESSQEGIYVFSVGGSFNLSDTPSRKYRQPSGEHWAGDVIVRSTILNDSLGRSFRAQQIFFLSFVFFFF